MKQSDRRKLMLAGLGGLITQLAAPGAAAQDPARVMPRAYRVAFENDQLRVLEFIGRPGMGICGEGWHSHPPHLTIVLADWQALSTAQGGAPKPRERKFGEMFWAEAETHKVENVGTTDSRVLIVELKAPAKPKA